MSHIQIKFKKYISLFKVFNNRWKKSHPISLQIMKKIFLKQKKSPLLLFCKKFLKGTVVLWIMIVLCLVLLPNTFPNASVATPYTQTSFLSLKKLCYSAHQIQDQKKPFSWTKDICIVLKSNLFENRHWKREFTEFPVKK